MNTSNASTILRLSGSMKRSRFRMGRSATLTTRIIAAFGRSSGRLALILLAVGFFLLTAWSDRVFSHSGAVVDTMESVGLFADSAGSTPKTVFNRGDKVWGIETGAPPPLLGLPQRRFQWVAPDGTVKQQADIIALDPQSDLYQLSTSAQLGTWKVKTIDNSNVGFAVADFVVRDPANAAADLSVGLFASSRVAAGTSIAYSLQVTNNGPDDAQDVEITDAVSGDATFQSLTPEKGWSCPGGALPCSIASLARGQTAVFTVIYHVSDAVPADTIISNTAIASSSTTELHSPDNTSTTDATVTGASTCTFSCPENITQAHDPGTNGAVVNYTIPTMSSCPCVPAHPENCVSGSPASGSFFSAGVTTVVLSSLSGGSCSFTVTVTGTVTITLDGPDPLIVECHTEFLEPGVTAQNDRGTSVPVTSSVGTTVDLTRPGTYTINYSAMDGGFTATATRTVVVVDTTPPVITLNGANPMIVPVGSTFTDPGATALDACADRNPIPVTASGSVDTNTTGLYEITYTATDGTNTSTSIRTVIVPYVFTGFFTPIGNPPDLNVVQAGGSIAVKFSLSGDKGLDILAPGYPKVLLLDCTSNAGSEVQETTTAGDSTLQYDPGSDRYTYVWKTEKAWAGTCRQLVIKLNDETVHIARFKFK